MKSEILIYGVPPGHEDETILYTLAETPAEALRVMAVLERDHGCTRCRVWNLVPGEWSPERVKRAFAA